MPLSFYIKEAGEVIAGAIVYPRFDWLYIDVVYVNEDQRGKHIGQNFLSGVENDGHAHNAIGLELET